MVAVRQLTPDQAALFRALRLEARASDPEAFRASLEQEAARPLQWYADRLASDPVFGAFDEAGELVGMAGFTPGGGTRNGPKGRVWTVYVRGALRGRRIGARLMDAVIAHARARTPVLHLSVMANNAPARKLYERAGFGLVAVEDADTPGAEAHYAMPLTGTAGHPDPAAL